MNKLLKKVICTACCGVLVGLSIFAIKSNDKEPKISCDYPGFLSLEEMTEASNLIVNGIIVNDNGISLIDAGAGEREYRTYDIKVTMCIKGDALADEIIPIKILKTTDNTDDLLVNNNEYICFLEKYDNGIPASLINMDQSTMLVNDNDLILSEEEMVIINKSFNENNDIIPTTDSKIHVSKDMLINKLDKISKD